MGMFTLNHRGLFGNHPSFLLSYLFLQFDLIKLIPCHQNIGANGPLKIYKVLIQKSKAYIPLRRKTACVGQFCVINAKDSTFALPNAKNTNMLVSLALGHANVLRWPCTFNFLCVDFIRVG